MSSKMSHLSVSSPFFVLIILTFLQLHIPIEATNDKFTECHKTYQCGNVTISYPFYDDYDRPAYCGYPGFKIDCRDAWPLFIMPYSQKYYLLGMDPNSHTVSFARDGVWGNLTNLCLKPLSNTTLNFTLFNYTNADENVTLYYECFKEPISKGYTLFCPNSNFKHPYGYFMTKELKSTHPDIPSNECESSISVPIYQSNSKNIRNYVGLQSALNEGFELEWFADNYFCDDCRSSGGECGYNTDQSKFTCHCSDGSNDVKCPGEKPSKRLVIIGVSVGGSVVAALLAACLFMVRRRKRILSQARTKDLPSLSTNFASSNGFHSSRGYTTSPSTYMSRTTASYPSSKSDLDNSSYLGVKLFRYSELEEATDNFSESRELGDGGFGTVYYGKLNDGRVVAVKRLYENSVKRMGQFMNEVQILAHLRHDNLVTLHGCTSKRSRELLLVYEYISNGTVADHLHGKLSVSNKLPWSIRLSIAVETAEALSFLHDKDVIHRDVKTTNILLDDNFRVKVADFGLSRLFPNDVTHVSTAPQGTPGYVDPDYYQCYHLTEKSDVYSFGVVMMELISSKVAVDITRHRHDINLSNMAIDRIQKHALHELVDPHLDYDKDYVVQKMVKSTAELAFQCLQPDKETRPTMKEVLKSLKDIQKTIADAQNQVVVDIQESDDDVGLLKIDPPFSPETRVNGKQ